VLLLANAVVSFVAAVGEQEVISEEARRWIKDYLNSLRR